MNFYAFLQLLEQIQASSEMILPDDPVTIEVPKFGRTIDEIKISPRKMAEEMEYSILNVDGTYHLYDKYKDYVAYKSKNSKEVIDFLINNYIRYKMGVLLRRPSAYSSHY